VSNFQQVYFAVSSLRSECIKGSYKALGSEISGFRREGYENCALLGYYLESSGNSYTLRNIPEERGSQRLSVSGTWRVTVSEI
jgi:hypothetical protein